MDRLTPVVALITDFGRADSYVAEVHLAIARRVPAARVLDVSHDLAPFDLAAAALVVERTLGGLPPGAALAVVVDPGVGTSRARIAARVGRCWAVGPDNGVLPVRPGATPVWRIAALAPAPGVATFDGREVFGPVAALLAAGLHPSLVGPKHPGALTWVMPDDARFEPEGEWAYARGVVIARDRFGNAVTNVRLPAQGVAQVGAEVVAPAAFAGPVKRSYGDVARGAAVALTGSGGRLELCVREGSSALVPGEAVVVRCAR